MLPATLLRRTSLGLLFGALASSGRADLVPDPVAIVPHVAISLFNGRDLSSFYTWLPKDGHSDPDRVFTVVENIDGAPAIRISGQHFGSLLTRARYAHYRLVAEYRWGTVTWRPRKNMARNSGILVNCRGEDGNARKTFDAPWPRAIELQVSEGRTGDFVIVSGCDRGSPERIFPRLTVTVLPGTIRWNPTGHPTVFDRVEVDWKDHDPDFKDVLGFRGPKDLEKPVGEWNRIEAICDGGHLVYFVNGIKVNEGFDCSFQDGQLLLESEGSEIFFRRVELWPLSPGSGS